MVADSKQSKRVNGDSGLMIYFKEPLVHFFAIALLMLSLAHFLAPQSIDTIDLSEMPLASFKSSYRKIHGTSPDVQHLKAFQQNWLNEELLYREGLALGLEKTDPVIRQQIITNMQTLLLRTNADKQPGEMELRRFYQEHQHDYLNAATYDAMLLSVAEPSQVTLLLNALQNGADPKKLPGSLQIEHQRSAGLLAAKYGKELVAKLTASATANQNGWFVVQGAQQRWWLAKLTGYRAEVRPDLEEIKTQLVKDWQKQQQKRAVEQQLARIKKQYQIVGQENVSTL